MNPQVTNIVVMLVMMQASRKIDMENEQNIFYIRVLYAVCFAITFGIYQLARRAIVAKNDTTELKFKHKEPSSKQEVDVVTTVKEYDLREVDNAIKGIFQSLAMMGFMHFYMGYVNPLFMQSISPVKSALEHNEVQINLFGKPAVGPLKRPFKTPSMFENLMNAGTGAQAPGTDVDDDLPKIEEINDDVAAEGVKAE